jgi:hypothetical protein
MFLTNVLGKILRFARWMPDRMNRVDLHQWSHPGNGHTGKRWPTYHYKFWVDEWLASSTRGIMQ